MTMMRSALSTLVAALLLHASTGNSVNRVTESPIRTADQNRNLLGNVGNTLDPRNLVGATGSPGTNVASPVTNNLNDATNPLRDILNSLGDIRRQQSEDRNALDALRSSLNDVARPTTENPLNEVLSSLTDLRRSMGENRNALNELRSSMNRSGTPVTAERAQPAGDANPLREILGSLGEMRQSMTENRNALEQLRSSVGNSGTGNPAAQIRSSVEENRNALKDMQRSLATNGNGSNEKTSRLSKGPLGLLLSPLRIIGGTLAGVTRDPAAAGGGGAVRTTRNATIQDGDLGRAGNNATGYDDTLTGRNRIGGSINPPEIQNLVDRARYMVNRLESVVNNFVRPQERTTTTQQTVPSQLQ